MFNVVFFFAYLTLIPVINNIINIIINSGSDSDAHNPFFFLLLLFY
jgi:hypothetical protein